MSDDVVKARFATWLDEGTRLPTLVGSAVTMSAFVSFGFVDRLYTTNSEVLHRLLLIRLCIVLVLAVLLALRVWTTAKGRGAVFGSVLLLCITLGVSWVAAALGGVPTGYHDAVAIGMISYGAGMPSSTLRTGVLCAFSVIAYFVMVGCFSASGLAPLFAAATQAVILTIAAVWATGTSYFRNEAKRRENAILLRLEQLDAAKTVFFANVNHELRTPIMVNLASLESIREESQSKTLQQYADTAYRNGLRLLAMVDQLLTLSRLEASDASSLRLTRWSLDNFLLQQVQQVQPLAGKKEVALSLAAQNPVVSVFADKELVGEVVLNLLTNALKFTKPGGSIEVGLRLVDTIAHVSVTDTGAGIAEQDQPHIFKRFYQASGAKGGRAGVGIGLSMCERVIDLHDGKIGIIRSKLGEGTSIGFSLPKADANPPPADVQPTGLADATGASGAMPEWDKRLRQDSGYVLAGIQAASERRRVERGDDNDKAVSILIVDDDRDMLEVIRNMVSDCNVHVASDGSEGLELARRLRPSVIISDVNMPIMDGFTMLAEIRRDAQLKDVPVIMMTARGEVQDRQAASENEADEFLPKPFTRSKLDPVLARLLKRQTAQVAQVEKAAQEAAKLVVSKLAHEIMNPVSFLKKAAVVADRHFKAVADRLPSDEALDASRAAHQRSVDSLRSGLLRVTEAVEELKRWSKSQDAGDPVVVEITPLVQRATVLAHESATINQILEAKSRVALRPGQFERVILNLVLNAIEAGGQGCEITIKTSDDLEQQVAVVEVIDRGPGIEPGTLEKIFDPHFTTKATGSGLGLAMCRDIVRQHGGRLKVDSQPGRGTTFKITLPMVA